MYRSIMSKKPTDMSQVTELHKTTFADILNIFGQRKIRIKPHTPKLEFTCSIVQRQQMNPSEIDGYKLEYCLHKIPLCLPITKLRGVV